MVVPRPLAQSRLYDDRSFDDADISAPGLTLVESSACRASSRDQLTIRQANRFHAPLVLRLWHLASLDAPTVALVWCMAFACVLNVRLPLWVLVLAPLGVWTVYVADRLLDARAGMRFLHVEDLHERHHFHWRYCRVFVPMAVVSALGVAWMVIALMPRISFEHNSVLAAASILYFTRVHSRRTFLPLRSKEFLVGVLFTIGCAIPAISRVDQSHRLPGALLPVILAFFALLAWLNCSAIDRWETLHADFGHNRIALASLLLAAAGVLCSALLFAWHPRAACLLACGAAAALLLALLDRIRHRLTPVTLRAAADLALLTPALLLPFASFLRQ